ncbi:scyllo-inositol 2-dehydrogenase (NADP(+)) [Thalassocella blandensis]|nr:scyllo-inositol 2-dehydrogenase (NADP(+)) [Thalassocella blandensis]
MINVALCSFGMSGKVFHAPLITAAPELHLHTILQRSKSDALDTYPDVHIAKSFEEILQHPDIDLVVVNTPNELHFPMTEAALKANKHVVVEKPFTLSISEGEALIQLAQQQQRVLAVFQNKRLESDFLDAKAALDSGKLGRIVEVEWHYDRYRTHVTHKRWKEDKLPGSGTWYDLGIHMVDSMLSLFDMPEFVTADMRSLRRAEGSVDYFNVRFDYPDFRVILRSNTFVSEKTATVAIHGDKGSFLKFGQDVQEGQLQQGVLPGMSGWAVPGDDNLAIIHSHINGDAIREELSGSTGCYEEFYNNIGNTIQQKEPLAFSAARSLQGVRLLLAAEESQATAKTVAIN